MSDETPGPYTASSLAEAAGVAPTYVARLCRAGKLECRRLGPVWLIARAEGKRWMASRRAKCRRKTSA